MKSILGAYLTCHVDGDLGATYTLTTWEGGLLGGPRDGLHDSADLSPAQAVDACDLWADTRPQLALGAGNCSPVIMCRGAGSILQPLLPILAARYRLSVAAKTQGMIYALKAFTPSGRLVMTFWDVCHMDRRPLAEWATAVGMDLRDASPCEVTLSYLRRMMEDVPEVDEEELGTRIITATGLARAVVRETVGRIEVGEGRSVRSFYAIDAYREAPTSFEQYGMRKACMRGGFSFAAARHAGKLLHDVTSFDESSAHHACALAHRVPERFAPASAKALTAAAETVAATSVDDLLRRFDWPWPCAFHALIRFEGLRLREGSVWERDEVGLVSLLRFADSTHIVGARDDGTEAQEGALRAAGFADRIEGAVWAFGHLMSATALETWVTDLEVWCMSRVYTWDSMRAIEGEATGHRKKPDDLAVLSTMSMYAKKAAAKAKLQAMPPSLRRDAEGAYIDVIKARYNAVGFGIHCMDDLKPKMEVTSDGEIVTSGVVDSDEAFEAARPDRWRTWYTFGSRIAGWSRVVLIVAAELIWAAHGEAAALVGGDTDSLKYMGVSPEDILTTLEPLHEATWRSIHRVTDRAARTAPRLYSTPIAMALGRFEVEERFTSFVQGWTKAYGGITPEGEVTIRMAGVPRSGEWSLSAWVSMMVSTYGAEALLRLYRPGLFLQPDLSQVATPEFVHGQLPIIRRVPYNVRDLTKRDCITSIRWQKAHGRDDQAATDGTAVAGWRNGRPYLATAEELLEG